MSAIKLDKSTRGTIDDLIDIYLSNRETFSRVAENVHNLLRSYSKLTPLIHSLKYRVKDPDHLKRKLVRKAQEALANGAEFDINSENFFEKINDFAGVRLLHLHTEQMEQIDPLIRGILDAERYRIVEGPTANTWDVEYETFFRKIHIDTKSTDSLYTSVHYIIEANNRDLTKCELQVRTLMEEVWGEVSHMITYPELTPSIACQEQIRVLARITSSGTRLVDSIFRSHQEFTQLNAKIKAKKKKALPKPKK